MHLPASKPLSRGRDSCFFILSSPLIPLVPDHPTALYHAGMAQKLGDQYETSPGTPQPFSQSLSVHPDPGSLSQLSKFILRTP